MSEYLRRFVSSPVIRGVGFARPARLDAGPHACHDFRMPLSAFHPAVARWFGEHFDAPSEVQVQAWPAIRAGRPTLIAAPTGSGKTLAAFLAAIDQLIRDGLEAPLPDATQVLYVSPLKALSNDIHRNLELPLNGIRDALLESGLPDVPVRAQVRTGDTSTAARAAMKRNPPHILVTTPESLYLLLTSDSGRAMLRTVRSVIVDEIHALAGNKRGAHLTLSLERLAQMTAQPPVRIGSVRHAKTHRDHGALSDRGARHGAAPSSTPATCANGICASR